MNIVTRLILLLAFSCTAGHAHSQLYLGGIFGASENDAPDANEVTGEPGLEGDVGFRAYLGNQLSEKFAFEVAYIDLGEYDAGEFDFQGEAIEDIAMIDGYEASFVGRLPIGQKFSAFARVGLFVWQVERPFVERRTVDGEIQLELVRDKTVDDFDFSGGLGVEYRYSRFLGATLEVNTYQTFDLINYLYGAGVYFSF